jgi:TonB family protein
MSAAVVHAGGWSRWRWLLATLLILAAQLGIVFWLSERTAPPARPPGPGARLTVLPVAARELADASQAPWRSPTAFVGVGAGSFSGPVWLGFPELDHQLHHWDEPAPMLALGPAGLGSWPGTATPPAAGSSGPIVSKPAPVPMGGLAAPLPLTERTRWVIGGALASRRLETTPTPPDWPLTNLLAATEVEIGVAPSGLVWSARLVTSCGLEAADQSALRLARAMRFEPQAQQAPDAPSGALPATWPAVVWGTLRLEWQLAADQATAAPRLSGP